MCFNATLVSSKKASHHGVVQLISAWLALALGAAEDLLRSQRLNYWQYRPPRQPTIVFHSLNPSIFRRMMMLFLLKLCHNKQD
ncbi:hypothetical protein F5Y16DRAFT_272393 [Xylariaceae sp. FL0255]|nr:hypothetical protein F5Y16DRAFT_272393 [Xylariaceae sp. FL0255]